MSQRNRVFIGCCLAAVSICLCSCEYDSEYDTLSTFPGNQQGKTIDEIDLVQLESAEDAEFLAVGSDTEHQALDLPRAFEPSAGVKGFPFIRDEKSPCGQFVYLAPEVTGLQAANKRELKPQDGPLLSTPFSSVGIAAGDLGGDGLPDIVIADHQTGCRLFTNLGDFQFEETTDVADIKSQSWGITPTLVDINHDGLLDIYLCCYDSPNRLFINRGRKFVEQAEKYGLDFKGASVAASFADYDRDGDLDLYLVTHRLPQPNFPEKLPVDREPGKPPRIKEEYREANHLIPFKNGSYVPVESGQYDRLFCNDGARFVDVTDDGRMPKYPYRGNAARWFDFDGDDWPDLLVTNDGKDPDLLLKNLGPDDDGAVQFQDVSKQFLATTTWFSKGTGLSDLNGDGRLDLLVAGNSGRLPNERAAGRGHLLSQTEDSWFLNNSRPSQTLGNSAYVNFAEGGMLNIAKSMGVGSSGDTSAICCCDFDNDGVEDIWFANGSVRDFLNNDLNQKLRAIKTGEKAERWAAFWSAEKPKALVDVLYRHAGDEGFQFASTKWGIEQAAVTRAIGSADFNNDGNIDIACINAEGAVCLYKNDISDSNSIRVKLRGQNSNTSGCGATVRMIVADGEAGAVRYVSDSGSFLSSQSNEVHFGLGKSESVWRLEIEWPTGNRQILNDLPANYTYVVDEPQSSRGFGRGLKMDLANPLLAKEDVELSGRVDQELAFDDFDEQPLLPFKHSQLGPGHAWGDIDGDGDDDLYVGGAAFEKPTLYINNGNLDFTLAATTAFDSDVRCEDMGAVFFDCDGDRDLDLFVVSGGVESSLSSDAMKDRLYLNDGKGRFKKSAERMATYQSSGGPVCVADFDRDGSLDVFVGGRIVPNQFPDTPNSVLLQNKGGQLVNKTNATAPGLGKLGMVSGCMWVDVDGDGNQDLMVVCQYGSTYCFQNNDGRLVDVSARAGLSERLGLFNSIAAGDVDNDGDTDFVVGNLGTNTNYRATDSDPMRLYVVESGDDNQRQLLEVFSSDGKTYSLRSLDLLGRHIKGLSSTGLSSADFSRLEIDEVISLANVETTDILTLNCLESGVWINESVGSAIDFRFEPLPDVVQSSPLFGCQLSDIDGDGKLDLIGVQNCFEVHPFTERFGDGRGVLLVGQGNGQFTLPKIESGFAITASGRSLTTVDLNSDGRCDLVAATNDDGVHFYSNASRHAPFALDLRQISEGKNYLGAQVILQFIDGTKQLHQIASNTGYLSQSPPIVYSGLKNDKEIDTIKIVWPDGTVKSDTVKNLLRQR